VGNFSFSWTRLKNWRACPKRHYHIEVAKDIVEPQNEALRWGDEFHKSMAAHIEHGTPLPDSMKKYAALPAMMRHHKEKGADVNVELKLAMGRDFQPTGWQEWDRTWLRGIVDVLYLSPKQASAAAIDWKTGQKIEPSMEQLGLSAALIFAKHPEIDTVHTAYQWAAHGTDTQATYLRDEMVPFWNKLLPELKRWEKDASEMTYPPRPSGLCKRHCPVTHCAYHGRGSR
jgi:PD-(D/E)XK nuclease superfamily